MRELEEVIETEDWPQVRRLSHQLKSTWGNLRDPTGISHGGSNGGPGTKQSKRDTSATGRDLVADVDGYPRQAVRNIGLI